MFKNVASQKVAVFAWDNAAGSAKTGDAGNITAQISIDAGAATATDDTNPTELDAADHPGTYIFDMLQAETNGDLIVITPVSGTGDIVLRPVYIYTNISNAIETDTQNIQSRIPAALSSGNIKADVLAISTSTAAADNLEASAETIVTGTVSHDNTAASTTVFYSDDITEATADHFNNRIIIFTSGDLLYQATDISAYELVSGEGQFTVGELTEAPADNVTFVIV